MMRFLYDLIHYELTSKWIKMFKINTAKPLSSVLLKVWQFLLGSLTLRKRTPSFKHGLCFSRQTLKPALNHIVKLISCCFPSKMTQFDIKSCVATNKVFSSKTSKSASYKSIYLLLLRHFLASLNRASEVKWTRQWLKFNNFLGIFNAQSGSQFLCVCVRVCVCARTCMRACVCVVKVKGKKMAWYLRAALPIFASTKYLQNVM